mgnify:CR=1 FL=1
MIETIAPMIGAAIANKGTVNMPDPNTRISTDTVGMTPTMFRSTFDENFKRQNPATAAIHGYKHKFQPEMSTGYKLGERFGRPLVNSGVDMLGKFFNQGSGMAGGMGALGGAGLGAMGAYGLNAIRGDDAISPMYAALFGALGGGLFGGIGGHLADKVNSGGLNYSRPRGPYSVKPQEYSNYFNSMGVPGKSASYKAPSTEEGAAFSKAHGSAFDINSSMDRGKMNQLRNTTPAPAGTSTPSTTTAAPTTPSLRSPAPATAAPAPTQPSLRSNAAPSSQQPTPTAPGLKSSPAQPAQPAVPNAAPQSEAPPAPPPTPTPSAPPEQPSNYIGSGNTAQAQARSTVAQQMAAGGPIGSGSRPKYNIPTTTPEEIARSQQVSQYYNGGQQRAQAPAPASPTAQPVSTPGAMVAPTWQQVQQRSQSNQTNREFDDRQRATYERYMNSANPHLREYAQEQMAKNPHLAGQPYADPRSMVPGPSHETRSMHDTFRTPEQIMQQQRVSAVNQQFDTRERDNQARWKSWGVEKGASTRRHSALQLFQKSADWRDGGSGNYRDTMDEVNKIISVIRGAPGMTVGEKAQMMDGVSGLSSRDLINLTQLIGSSSGAVAGAIVARFLLNRGLIGTLLGGLAGGVIGGSMFGRKATGPTTFLGESLHY